MTILILGAKGFIGSHCMKYFSSNNIVHGADIITDIENSKYILLDQYNADYSGILSKHQFDVCINCSGAANVPDSLLNPYKDFELNSINVFKILEAISKYQPTCKFLNLSSAAVYGNPQSLPISEDSVINPLSPYGWYKYYAEQICKEFVTTKSSKTCSIRIFSAFGEGLKKQLFWDIYQKAKKLKVVELFGTGSESRDFIYIKDLVKCIEIIIQKAPFNGECINVANGEEIFLKDAVPSFIRLFDKEIQVSFTRSNRTGDPLNWCADISVIRKMGYVQQFTIQKGLNNYVEWLTKEKL